MNSRRVRSLIFMLALGLGAVATTRRAQADIIPAPDRPAWDTHPPPMPAPPPEKDFERGVVVAMVGLGALALAMGAQRRRLARSSLRRGSA